MSISPSGDRIYGFTKFVAALLGIVVFFAFVVLYFFPTRTKQLFAWPIAPPMTAMFMGASYANGAIFFSAVLLGKKWHRVWAPHIGVFMFATLLLIATILHWDRFNHAHPVFYIWVFIYAVAPILTPWALIRNLKEDRNVPDERDAVVPLGLRIAWLIPGILFLGAALYAFVNPAWLIPHWPWKATRLGSEDRLRGLNYALQGMVMIRRIKSPVVLAGVPHWLQRAVAWVFTPIAELFGYRAVYRRFSGEEW